MRSASRVCWYDDVLFRAMVAAEAGRRPVYLNSPHPFDEAARRRHELTWIASRTRREAILTPVRRALFAQREGANGEIRDLLGRGE